MRSACGGSGERSGGAFSVVRRSSRWRGVHGGGRICGYACHPAGDCLGRSCKRPFALPLTRTGLRLPCILSQTLWVSRPDRPSRQGRASGARIQPHLPHPGRRARMALSEAHGVPTPSPAPANDLIGSASLLVRPWPRGPEARFGRKGRQGGSLGSTGSFGTDRQQAAARAGSGAGELHAPEGLLRRPGRAWACSVSSGTIFSVAR